MNEVDWLRVDMVCSEGTAMALNRAEQRMAVRRLRHKIGKTLTAFDIADRVGMSDRHVWRLVADMDSDTEARCPVCGERMWVSGGVVEEHPDSLLTVCPLSGRPDPDLDWESWAALTVKWLAQRLRAGDVEGVNRFIAGQDASQLLVVALAAVPVDVPVDELFAWVGEVA